LKKKENTLTIMTTDQEKALHKEKEREYLDHPQARMENSALTIRRI
jgi:hypothetical protein